MRTDRLPKRLRQHIEARIAEIAAENRRASRERLGHWLDALAPEWRRKALNPETDTLREGDQFAFPHDHGTWYTLGPLAIGETFLPDCLYRRP